MNNEGNEIKRRRGSRATLGETQLAELEMRHHKIIKNLKDPSRKLEAEREFVRKRARLEQLSAIEPDKGREKHGRLRRSRPQPDSNALFQRLLFLSWLYGIRLPALFAAKVSRAILRVSGVRIARRRVCVRFAGPDKARTDSAHQTVEFVREEKSRRIGEIGQLQTEVDVTKRIYRAPNESAAVSFLQSTTVTQRFSYIEVETPEGWFGKDIDGIYGESGRDLEGVDRDDNPAGYFHPIFSTAYLDHWTEAALTALDRVPGVIGDHWKIGYQLFHADVGGIAEFLRQVGRTSKQNDIMSYWPDKPVCLLVSAFPWRTEEVSANLVTRSRGGGRLYTEVLDSMLRQRPSPHLTHWVHLVICMIDGRIYAGTGTYNGPREMWQAYSWPVECKRPLNGTYRWSARSASLLCQEVRHGREEGEHEATESGRARALLSKLAESGEDVDPVRRRQGSTCRRFGGGSGI